MDFFANFIKFLLALGLGVVAIYIIARLVSYAAAKSWYQAKRNEEEIKNGEKKEEIE